jgi:hypothetical protein
MLSSGDVCTIGCNPGYHLSGDTYFACSYGNMFLKQQCNPNDCVVDVPDHGGLGNCPPLLASSGRCSISCNSSFAVVGSITSCLAGQLSAQSCGGNPCNVPAPLNGNMGGCPAVLSSGSTCQAGCNDGYVLTGSQTKCLNGVLQSTQTCVSAPCSMDVPANGGLGSGATACSTVLQSGQQCQISCIPGFVKNGTVTLCQNGKIQASQNCVPAPCAVAPGANMNWGTCSASLGNNQTCVLGCNSGYHPSGDGAYTHCSYGTLDLKQACSADGCAVSTPAHGTKGDCPDLLSGNNGVCHITCNSSFGLQGTVTSCNAGSLNAQSCGGNPCAVPAPLNGDYGSCTSLLTTGSSCQFSCNDGFTLTGTSTTCLNGALSTQSCQPSSCQFNLPPNALLGSCSTVLGHQQSCQINCLPTFVKTGLATTCSFGKISQLQTCTPAPCTFSLPTAVDTKKGNCTGTTTSSLASGDNCQIGCINGFHLEGDSFFSCAYGTVASKQTCVADSCVVDVPVNGTRFQCPAILGSGLSCQIQCNEGYAKTGTQTSCLAGSLTAQSCGGNPCAVPAPLNGGYGTCSPSMTSGSSCQMNCTEGFQLTGTKTTCLNGGVAAQSCVPAPCALDQPVNGLYNYVRGVSRKFNEESFSALRWSDVLVFSVCSL